MTPGEARDIYNHLGYMVIMKDLATKAGTALYHYREHEQALYVYGTDGLDDWRHNLNGSSIDIPRVGVTYAQGGMDHASQIADSLGDAPVRQIYGHSLGAAAACHLHRWIQPQRTVLVGCPRIVIATSSPTTPADDPDSRIIDLTAPRDPVCQMPPWNDRLPWWLARRVRMPGHWSDELWQPVSTGLAAILVGLLLPVAGLTGMGWLGRMALRMVAAPHSIGSYREGLMEIASRGDRERVLAKAKEAQERGEDTT